MVDCLTMGGIHVHVCLAGSSTFLYKYLVFPLPLQLCSTADNRPPTTYPVRYSSHTASPPTQASTASYSPPRLAHKQSTATMPNVQVHQTSSRTSTSYASSSPASSVPHSARRVYGAGTSTSAWICCSLLILLNSSAYLQCRFVQWHPRYQPQQNRLSNGLSDTRIQGGLCNEIAGKQRCQSLAASRQPVERLARVYIDASLQPSTAFLRPSLAPDHGLLQRLSRKPILPPARPDCPPSARPALPAAAPLSSRHILRHQDSQVLNDIASGRDALQRVLFDAPGY